MEPSPNGKRNFDSISPSALTLLIMKGHTPIPFARQAAELALQPESFVPDFNKKDFSFWARVIHFEARYRSIDQLLADIPAQNILELSSGFSFRGLQAVKEKEVHYIDTDLPGIIERKKELVSQLKGKDFAPKGTLEILPLNALDEKSFWETTGRFPEGPLTIVNEGLLMYLGTEEKKKLCSIIHKVLSRRGGYWITADIYVRKTINRQIQFNDQLQAFLDQHRIEENKFESFEAAEAFFRDEGFVIDREAIPDYTKLSALPYFLQSATPEQLKQLEKTGKMQNTWRLRTA